MNIPYIDHGGSGAPLHFLHANGYPPACYAPFIAELKRSHHVLGMLLRPLWPASQPEELDDWHPLSDDLRSFLEEQRLGPVIGVGHSIGAIVSLRLALHDPQRFRALILLDPVLFPPHIIVFWNLMRWLGLGYRVHPLIPIALKRRRTFDDLEAVFQGYRRRPIFRYLSDENLRIYISGITRPRPQGGYELAYSPEWESRIYYTGVRRDLEIWRDLPGLKVPTLIVRGAETDTFLNRTARLVKRRQPGIRIHTLERSTHLLPLECPGEVYEVVQSYLKEVP
jgi:pimeloyl-ACP methyl ester carboxylesterase